jgi:hypothetical protein
VSVAEEEVVVRMPDFIRKALLAQGLYDPDEIERAAQHVDLTIPETHEQPPLFETPKHWQDRG